MALPAIADVRRACAAGAGSPWRRGRRSRRSSRLVPAVNDVVVLERKASIGACRRGAIGRRASGGGSTPRCCCRTRSMRRCMAWRAGIPERWGYRTRLSQSRLLTRAIAPPLAACIRRSTTSSSCTRSGFANGPLEPRLDGASRRARRARPRCCSSAQAGTATPLVALAPGAAYGGAKRWPPRRSPSWSTALAADGVQPC